MQSFESAVISDIYKKTGPARCRIRPLTAECQLSVHALRTSRAFAFVSLDGNEGGNDRFSCIGIVSFYSIAKIFCEYKKWC